MTGFAYERIRQRKLMAGLFFVKQETAAHFVLIEDLLLLDDCTTNSDWHNHILYLPLR